MCPFTWAPQKFLQGEAKSTHSLSSPSPLSTFTLPSLLSLSFRPLRSAVPSPLPFLFDCEAAPLNPRGCGEPVQRVSWQLFLPRDAMQPRPMSSCGVCVSVTFVHSVKTNENIFKILSPSGSHSILVLPFQTAWQLAIF